MPDVEVIRVPLGPGDDRARAGDALRVVLAERLGVRVAAVELERGPHGKPRLGGGASSLRFNVSHTAGLALVALADGIEVGVDAERIDPQRDVVSLARHGLGDAAAAELAALPTGRAVAEFHRRWVRHEAVLKCHGVGLVAPAPPGAAASVCDVDVGPGVAAAVAVAGEGPPTVRLR